MRTRKIGSLEVSLVGLGTNNFGRRLELDRTRAVIDAALDAGVTLLDTADTYGATRSEQFIGEVLAGRRERVVLATKFGMRIDDARAGGAKPGYIRRALEESLLRLRTDRIDLYQLHQPDRSTPLAETVGVLHELRDEGKIVEIGCSNFSRALLVEADGAFAAVQNEYSLLARGAEAEVLPYCEREGIAFLPYYPLANGLLTGKYRRGEAAPAGTRIAGLDPARRDSLLTDSALAAAGRFETFARERGHTLLELAFAWLAAQPAVASVIAGATSPEQVSANAAAIAWELSAEELAAIDLL